MPGEMCWSASRPCRSLPFPCSVLHLTKDLLNEYGGQDKDRFVAPGEYTVTLTFGEAKETQKLEVTIPPGVETR